MQVHQRDWTITLGASRGADIKRELEINRFKTSLAKNIEAYQAGDNATCQLPLISIDDHVLLCKDEDPQPGRVLIDRLAGKVAYKDKEKGANPDVQPRWSLRAAVELDPATGQTLSYTVPKSGIMTLTTST